MTVLVLYFQCEWSSLCQSQESKINRVIKERKDKNIKFKIFNADNCDHMVDSLDINAIPTVIFAINDDDENMREYRRFVGVTESDKIETAINNGLKRIN